MDGSIPTDTVVWGAGIVIGVIGALLGIIATLGGRIFNRMANSLDSLDEHVQEMSSKITVLSEGQKFQGVDIKRLQEDVEELQQWVWELRINTGSTRPKVPTQ